MAGTATVSADWAPVAERIRKEATDTWDDTAAVDRLTGAGRDSCVVGAPRRTRSRRGRRTGLRGDQGGRAQHRGPELGAADPRARGHAVLDEPPGHRGRGGARFHDHPGRGPDRPRARQVFSRFGAEVTVVEVADRLLAVEDPESSELIQSVFTEEGIESLPVRPSPESPTATASPSRSRAGPTSAPRAAGGDRPASRPGGSAGGHRRARRGGEVDPVDEHLRAGPGLWAIGDVTGIGPFTHVSMYQSAIAVSDILARRMPRPTIVPFPG